MTNPSSQPSSFPEPELRRIFQFSYLWILPGIALLVVLLLGFQAWLNQAPAITVRFANGNGIKPGDPLRFRGAFAGSVREIRFPQDLSAVNISIQLAPEARSIARAGSQFWIVRPQASIYGLKGFDTVIGTHYLEVIPGSGSPCVDFVGSEDSPIPETRQSDSLEISLQASRRGNLLPGMPITYRQTIIGVVSSVELSPFSTHIELKVVIYPAYKPLIRENTRFWNSSGVGVNLGFLKGLTIDVDSLQSMIAGGIALAVPDTVGRRVGSEHLFQIADNPEKEWFSWNPLIPLSNIATSPPRTFPAPVYARMNEPAGIFGHSGFREGWLLPIRKGYFGPAGLLSEAGTQIELGSKSVILTGSATFSDKHLTLVETSLVTQSWLIEQVWTGTDAVDMVAFADPTDFPLFIRRDQLRPVPGGFAVSSDIPVSRRWEGASVLTAEGKLAGILLLDPSGTAILRRLPLGEW